MKRQADLRLLILGFSLVIGLSVSLVWAVDEPDYKKVAPKEEESSFIPMKEANVLIEHEYFLEEKQNAIDKLRNKDSKTSSWLKKLNEGDEDEEEEEDYDPLKDEKKEGVVTEEITEKRDKSETAGEEYIEEKAKEIKKPEKKEEGLSSLEDDLEGETQKVEDKSDKKIDQLESISKEDTLKKTDLELRSDEVSPPTVMKENDEVIEDYVIKKTKTPATIRDESELPFRREIELFQYKQEEKD